MEPLTDRETRVLELTADGLRPGAIAETLHLSIYTVRSHLEHLRWKLDAKHVAHAVAIGYRTRLLPLPPEPARPVRRTRKAGGA